VEKWKKIVSEEKKFYRIDYWNDPYHSQGVKQFKVSKKMEHEKPFFFSEN